MFWEEHFEGNMFRSFAIVIKTDVVSTPLSPVTIKTVPSFPDS